MLLPFKSTQTFWRLVFPVLLFSLEAGAFHANLQARIGASFLFRWALVSLAVFLCGGFLKHRAAFRDLRNELAESSVNARFLGGHAAALLLLAGVTWTLLHAQPDFLQGVFLLAVWYLALLTAMVCGALAFLRWPAISEILRRSGRLWMYAALVGIAAVWSSSRTSAGEIDKTIWLSGVKGTFVLVEALLRLFTAHVVADPAASRIGTERFTVNIAMGCTGIEGITLILVFGAAWLWFFRDELRFPRSLLLLPASVVLIYLLNSVRLAALILIGHAGAGNIATGGFHANAGWIFFSAVALSLVYATQTRWFAAGIIPAQSASPFGADPIPLDDAQPRATNGAFAEENPTAVYLAPLLAIMAAAMITSAVSAGFDWLYPLRFAAAAAVLWTYRRRYRALDWRFSATSVILGVAVFAIWIAPDVFAGPSSAASGKGLADGLAALPGWGRVLWMTFRVLGATLTVPIAEELAFRGFALRRLQSADFESVSWRSFTWPALLISSLIFGLLHGQRWMVGTVAGLIYAAAMLRRGRLGDAAVAHATTNALLAVWVITRGAWYLW